MKNIFHLLCPAVFACTSLLFSACGSSKSDPTPTPTTPTAQTGTLNGQITPAASITTVTATDAANKNTTATPNATGAYSFTGLAAGTYTLIFTAATGYTAPANQTGVVVTAGGTTTAAPITVTSSTSNNGRVNGQITPANAITTVTAVSASNQPITTTPLASGAYTFSLAAGNYTLRFTPATGFTAPADQLISVSAGGTTTPTPTNVTQSGGTATLTVNGTAVAVNLVRAELAFGDLSLTLITATGESVVLHVSPYTSGTSRTGNFAGVSDARLRYTDGSAEWAAATTGNPVGAYTVTPAGTSPSRVSGTFNAPLNPTTSGAAGTKTVSGTFTTVAY
ncbi:MAG: hypothetical protein M3Y54_22485 [Bacteroidota bacterium]|nr:hypothetical protein [Bacteroidota bacterium]